MDGIHLMATAMHAAHFRLDVAADNLANVSTSGFQKRVAYLRLEPTGLHASAVEDRARGPLERTGRPLDLALVGNGFLSVRDANGAIARIRSGSFERSVHGEFTDDRGRVLMGTRGPLIAGEDVTIDARGYVREAGDAVGRIPLPRGTTLESGFLERANVDSAREMVDVLGAERAFETAQKTLSAIDETRQKDVNDVARIKQ